MPSVQNTMFGASRSRLRIALGTDLSLSPGGVGGQRNQNPPHKKKKIIIIIKGSIVFLWSPSLVINRQSVIYSPSLLTLLETTDSPPFQLKITAQNPSVPFHDPFHDPSPTSPIPRRSRTVYVALIFYPRRKQPHVEDRHRGHFVGEAKSGLSIHEYPSLRTRKPSWYLRDYI